MMAKLTTKARKALPASTFAGPNRSFPIQNKGHAVAAERDVPRAERSGSITLAQGANILRKARKKLGG